MNHRSVLVEQQRTNTARSQGRSEILTASGNLNRTSKQAFETAAVYGHYLVLEGTRIIRVISGLYKATLKML